MTARDIPLPLDDPTSTPPPVDAEPTGPAAQPSTTVGGRPEEAGC